MTQAVEPDFPPVLEAVDVGFEFGGGVRVLSGVGLTVAAGQSVAVMGASGAGKSTLLQVLAGLLPPSVGQVRLRGAAFSSEPSARRAELRLRSVGLVFQFGELVPELTVRENVELPALFLGRARDEAREAAESVLDSVDVGGLADRYPHQISGGQQQRAAIARALVNVPQLVLADEPTGALDDANADRVLDLLLSVPRERGGAVVVVTHSLAIAARCDVQLELSGGRLNALRPTP